jgi:hypothetical protein
MSPDRCERNFACWLPPIRGNNRLDAVTADRALSIIRDRYADCNGFERLAYSGPEQSSLTNPASA